MYPAILLCFLKIEIDCILTEQTLFSGMSYTTEDKSFLHLKNISVTEGLRETEERERGGGRVSGSLVLYENTKYS